MNFCTLFDSNYLSRGLLMYESLKQHHRSFHLYIYAFDQLSEEILKALNYPNITVVSLKEFEDQELLKVKSTRTNGEYCWTCTPSIILHAMNHFSLESCTYLDADLYFFSSTTEIFNEIKDNSVLITEHRYTPKYDQTLISGKYCVQFMYFKNNLQGLRVLKWWRDRCLEWCYARYEDGKFGDQKYLDDWTTRFQGIHVMKNLGGGIAPWNVQTYVPQRDPIIFYHFHGLKYNPDGTIFLSDYELNHSTIKSIYQEYAQKLIQTDLLLRSKFPSYQKEPEFNKPNVLRQIKNLIKRRHHHYYHIDQL